MSDLHWNRDFALEQAGDDEELLAELLMLLQESTAADLARIKASQARGEVQVMGEAAHSIKGAAASLGVETLRDVASGIEKAGRARDLAKASSYLPDLEQLIGELASLK